MVHSDIHPRVAAARAYATRCHAETHHTYDGHPYAYHLEQVAEAALPFVGVYPEEVQADILAACWCHDLIEDARQTYRDVLRVNGETVAEIVFALTNDKGRTREERAGARYYQGIRDTPHATLVKLCDRIANVRHSLLTQGRMLDVYRQEYPHFRAQLYRAGELEPVWACLDTLLGHPGRLFAQVS
ncbi:MAG: HD domain-containing protein [Bacteroidia bacterium]|nr:HD domain-containing protein [Bacteroidia bacterium]